MSVSSSLQQQEGDLLLREDSAQQCRKTGKEQQVWGHGLLPPGTPSMSFQWGHGLKDASPQVHRLLQAAGAGGTAFVSKATPVPSQVTTLEG